MVRSQFVRRDQFGGHIGNHQAVVVPEHGVAHRRLHADTRRRTDDHQLFDTTATKDSVQLSGIEAAVARLVEHDVAVDRTQLRDDVGVPAVPDKYLDGSPSGEVMSSPARAAGA